MTVVWEMIFFAQSIETSRKYVNARAVTSRTWVGANGSLKISQRATRKINIAILFFHVGKFYPEEKVEVDTWKIKSQYIKIYL
jgi:hypothetical protein